MSNKSTLGYLSNHGNTSGFDYLRLGLAICVLAWHSAGITYGREFAIYLTGTALGNVTLLILPAFFALSGFLVTSSLMRSRTLGEFMGLRLLRLIPALVVEISLSALILGPFFTVFDINSYFSDPKFLSYFLNVIGVIQYVLPGVYSDNAIPSVVNGSLWTVPYELECYLAVGLLWILRQRDNKYAPLAALLIWIGLLGIFTLLGVYEPLKPDSVSGRMLLSYFLSGVCLYYFRNQIPAKKSLFLLSIFIAVLTVKIKLFVLVTPLLVAYATVYVGLLRPVRLPYIFSGDYSYGIYLYAFPVQQAIYVLIPKYHSWGAHFVLSLTLTSLLAVFSWHAFRSTESTDNKSVRVCNG
ncbi:MAG: acyltransferase [Sphingobacteriaceae bacterium]|nr:MAG: acyltransferase [Sphingobacteriaceae bacterium]